MPISAAAAALGAAGIGAAGGLIGGAVQSNASAKQAKRQMEFQERMSNTAYQRSAADLEAAGLNRILALGSPATTPGGAMGQVANYGEIFQGAVNSGFNAYGTAQQVNQSEAQTDQILQQTKLINQKEKQEIEKTKVWQIIGPVLQTLGGSLPKLAETLTNPGIIGDLKAAFEYTKGNVINNIYTVIGENTGTSPETVQRIFEKAISTAVNPVGSAKQLFKEYIQ